nr:GntR family transcriptional regulator [uncultured Moellerella sp.]
MTNKNNKLLPSFLQDEILKLIKEKKISPDERIPTEHELMSSFNVSRSSIREALGNLKQEGIVYKIQGKGTFLRAKVHTLKNGIDTLFSVTEAITNCGCEPKTTRVSIQRIQADKMLAAKLQMPEGTACYQIHRVRTADNIVAVYNVNIFPVTVLGEHVLPKDLENSLFVYLESQGHIVSQARSNIKPTVLTRRDIPELESELRPFLLFDEVYYNTKGEIIGYTNDFYNSEIFHFDIIRKRHNL